MSAVFDEARTPQSAQTAPNALQRFFSLDNRFLAPILITCILLSGQLVFGILESWSKTLLAIVTCMVMEMVLSRGIAGKWPPLASAYISGISVGTLVRSPFLWPFVLCGALSI